MKALIAIFIIATTLSCTNQNGAEKALRQAGYHPIEVGGHCFYGCSEDDYISTRFKAYSPDSTMIVAGCVCENLLKGKTIRLD